MRTVAFRRTRATAPGENKGEKENLSTPLMNSERLKDFRQAAYELLVLALLCNIRAHGCSNDNKECGLFGGIFASVHYSIVNGQASMKPYKTVDQTGKN